MKNLFTENRLVFMSGPERAGGAEEMSSREAKQLDNKLNRLTKKFDGIKPGHVVSVMKMELKKDLEGSVIKALKKKLDPYNQKNADSLFSMMYPPDKLGPILKKAAQKLKRVKFSVSTENVQNIRFGSKTRFASLLATECGVSESDEPTISTGSQKPWENLGSKLASQASPSKLRSAVKKSGALARKAVTDATKNEMRQQAVSQIRNIIGSVA